MSTALVSNTTMSPGRLEPRAASSLPPVPWRDPLDVTPGGVGGLHRASQARVRREPAVRGSAHVPRHPENFWAQLKYAELHYRLRILDKAEEETRRAADLAASPLQLVLARRQLQEVRTLKQSCVRNVHWTKR